MKRTLLCLIPLCLLNLNILLCMATKNIPDNQIQLLHSNQYGSQVMTSEQSKLKKQLSNLLISPTPGSFKHEILPYLPSENVIKLYDHFRSFHPQLNLEKWLEGFITNPVVDFTDSFEKKILFRSPYQVLFLPILFSQKTKITITVQNLDFILLQDHLCVFLESTQKIVPFFLKAVSSHQNFFVADDPEFRTFFVCDEQFLTIAHGTMSDHEFYENENSEDGWYVKHISEAKNLKGWKNFAVALRYFVTMPYIKYLKCISPILDLLNAAWLRVFTCLESDDPGILKAIFLGLSMYIFKSLSFYISALPLEALALSLQMFLLKKKYFLLRIHWGLSLSLLLPYSLLFPKFIDGFLKNVIFRLDCKYVEEIKLNSFNAKPKSKMWLFSFLISKKRSFWFYFWLVCCVTTNFFSLFLIFLKNPFHV